MSAAYTDITIDQSAWSSDEKTQVKKAIAHHFEILNGDGTLDISSAATLNALWQKEQAKQLKRWYRAALRYEESLDNSDFDISTE